MSRDRDYFELEDKKFLTGLGVPAGELRDPWIWGGWTAGAVRRGVALMAREYKVDPQKLLAKALHTREKIQTEGKAGCQRLKQEACHR